MMHKSYQSVVPKLLPNLMKRKKKIKIKTVPQNLKSGDVENLISMMEDMTVIFQRAQGDF